MVKKQNKVNTKKPVSKGQNENSDKPRIITANTHYGTCTERLSPFGGLLALIKFLDLVKFEEIFNSRFIKPKRETALGNYNMVVGILMLVFIGFNRLNHFAYIRLDPIMCGFFKLEKLPVVSTYWRYLNSLGINQAKSVLHIMSILRERVWQLCKLNYDRINIDIDTTVETVYGNQQGGRKGHNTKHRGKKAYRPILAFIEQTREYISGKLRKGETVSGKQCAVFIKDIESRLPGCVKKVLIRADGEFLSWETIEALIKAGFDFIIGNKGCTPVFDPSTWYRPQKRKAIEYNSCIYQPQGWKKPCRFVAMRMLKKEFKGLNNYAQLPLFEDDLYTYRIFCASLKAKVHKVIEDYDKRADVENLIGESNREGLDAIPSSKFKNNYAYFQLVMLAYNIWRYTKMLAQHSTEEQKGEQCNSTKDVLNNIMDNTIRIARLKLLFIAAKLAFHDNVSKIRYSIHDARTSGMLRFLNFLDKERSKIKPWIEESLWPCRFSCSKA
jgi:hypothetical protein